MSSPYVRFSPDIVIFSLISEFSFFSEFCFKTICLVCFLNFFPATDIYAAPQATIPSTHKQILPIFPSFLKKKQASIKDWIFKTYRLKVAF